MTEPIVAERRLVGLYYRLGYPAAGALGCTTEYAQNCQVDQPGSSLPEGVVDPGDIYRALHRHGLFNFYRRHLDEI